jgi:hypothetical protein
MSFSLFPARCSFLFLFARPLLQIHFVKLYLPEKSAENFLRGKTGSRTPSNLLLLFASLIISFG